MVIVCPSCRHRLKLRDAKPGTYKPKCSKCKGRFELIITDDDSDPVVRAIDSDPANESVAAAVGEATTTSEKTVAHVDATVVAVNTPVSEDSDPYGEQPTVGDEPTGDEATAFEETVPSARSSAPKRLGGYRIVQELGRGAMGAVYLAKQISLDRLVALKVIQQRFAKDPTFLARFTREAYAAAQLAHHNVVQIYDLGADDKTNFFSMEYVRGQSLADLLDQNGAINAKEAVGYILQAARGLEFAHNHGMVHRDVKPANLLLNEQGVVKVADLGLVKTPDLESETLDAMDVDDSDASSLAAARSSVTMRNAVIGTPNYMAPEQAKNASKVDHRADIYSLGCTFYSLLTGRPPFAGGTVMEVISKHRVEPIVRPELVVEDVPAELSDIVMRMVAKSPDERYANASELIQDLETFLGVGEAGFKPDEEHVAKLEASVARFNGSTPAKTRKFVAIGFCAACGLLAIVTLPFSLNLSWACLALVVTSIASYFTISGLRQQTYLFEKARQFAYQTSWSDRFTLVGAFLLLLAVLLVLGWLPLSVAASVVGVACGSVFHFVFDRKVNDDRANATEPVEALFKQFRIQGTSEALIREFVLRFAGDNWEEYFESLFGFEAKMEARKFRQLEGLRPGKRFRAWREPILNWLDARLHAKDEERARDHLARVEQQGLEAQGVSGAEARAQARRMAEALVEQSASPAQIQPEEFGNDPIAAAAAKRARIKAMLAEARGGKEPPKQLLKDVIGVWLNRFCGARVRFLIGACLVIGCVLWMQQNGVLSGSEVRNAATSAWQDRELTDLSDIKLDVLQTTPLKVPIVGRFFNSLNAGIAGGLLVFSSLFHGWRMSAFLLPAATIAMFGTALGVPGIDLLGGSEGTSAIVAIVLALGGYVFGRSSQP